MRSPAYNWGEGNVARAIARNKAKGLPTDYSSLTMPVETHNYLPKLQAVKNIVRDPEKYGLVLADIPDAPYFAVVKTTRPMDVKRAAELAELSVDEFLALNPQHNRPVIAGADEHTILLPIDKAEIFAAKLELTDQPLVSWQAYRLKARRDAAAGGGQVRHVGRDAARGQRPRRALARSGRARAAGAGGAALRRRPSRWSMSSSPPCRRRAHVHLHGPAWRHARRASRHATASRWPS